MPYQHLKVTVTLEIIGNASVCGPVCHYLEHDNPHCAYCVLFDEELDLDDNGVPFRAQECLLSEDRYVTEEKA
jgi:hypothetical protein